MEVAVIDRPGSVPNTACNFSPSALIRWAKPISSRAIEANRRLIT